MNSNVNGGMDVLAFSTLTYNTILIGLKFLKNPSSVWTIIPNYMFSKLGGLKYFLLCNYNVEKNPSKTVQLP